MLGTSSTMNKKAEPRYKLTSSTFNILMYELIVLLKIMGLVYNVCGMYKWSMKWLRTEVSGSKLSGDKRTLGDSSHLP